MKLWKLVLAGLMALSLVGCGMMMPERSYLSEMERNDEGFFRPREDFPVVAGDTGRTYRTNREIKSRTPASVSEQLHDREQASLNSQLAKLEGAQSEGANNHYQQYRKRLGSTSEKIYFLSLRSRTERDEYLSSRGLLDTPSYTAYEMGHPAEDSQLLVNMSKQDVLSSWGRPERVDVAGKPSLENERWLYRRDGAVKYIYFEGGKVGGWSSNSSRSAGQNPFY